MSIKQTGIGSHIEWFKFEYKFWFNINRSEFLEDCCYTKYFRKFPERIIDMRMFRANELNKCSEIFLIFIFQVVNKFPGSTWAISASQLHGTNWHWWHTTDCSIIQACQRSNCNSFFIGITFIHYYTYYCSFKTSAFMRLRLVNGVKLNRIIGYCSIQYHFLTDRRSDFSSKLCRNSERMLMRNV